MGTLRALTSRVALSLVSLVSAEARAEDTGTVSVRGVCMPPGTSGPEVLRILQAELAPSRVRMVDDSPTPRGDHDVVLSIADCSETPSGARVAVWQHGDESELSVTLTDTSPAARSRTFALALAESVRDVLVVPRDPGFTLTPIETPPKQHATPTPGTTPRDAQHVGSGEERTRDAVGGLLFRGAAEFRFVPKTSTPLVGADLGVAGRRFAVGLSVLGTERSTPIGSVDLLALAALASADVVDLTPVFKVRASAELGVATASGSPSGTATGHTVASPHAALDAGLAALLPLDARWLLEVVAAVLSSNVDMAHADPVARMAYAEYLELERKTQTKYEYLRGQVLAMAGGTLEHSRLASRISHLIRAGVGDRPCETFTSDAKIRVDATDLTTYPDVAVICGRLERSAVDPEAATNPVVLVEVLSDSTEAYDRGEKFAHYRRIASLREYLLVSQREPRLELFRRTRSGSWELVDAGPGGAIELESVGARLAVDDVFASALES